jgi:hypothetical protein
LYIQIAIENIIIPPTTLAALKSPLTACDILENKPTPPIRKIRIDVINKIK